MKVATATLEDVLADRKAKGDPQGYRPETFLAQKLREGFDVVLLDYCEAMPDSTCTMVACKDLATKWRLETLLLGSAVVDLELAFMVPGQKITPELIGQIEAP